MIRVFYPLLFSLFAWQVMNAQAPIPPERIFVFFDGNKVLTHCKEDFNSIRYLQEFEDTVHIKFRYEYHACPDCPGSCDGRWYFYVWWMGQDWGIGSNAILAPDSLNYCVLVFIKNNTDTMKISFPFSEYNSPALDTIRFQKGNYRLVNSVIQKQHPAQNKFRTYEEKVEIRKQEQVRIKGIRCEIQFERKYDLRTKDSGDIVTRKTFYNTDGSESMKLWLHDSDTITKEIFMYDNNGHLSTQYKYGWKGTGSIAIEGWERTWGLQEMTTYSRDSNSNIRKIDRSNNWSESFSNDSNGNVIEQIIIQNDSTVRQKYIYRYDAHGNRIEQEFFEYSKTQEGKDTIRHFKCFWNYDSTGNVIEFIPMDEHKFEHRGKTVYHYDSNGHRTVEFNYDINGKQESHSYFKYDAKGNLIESKNLQSHHYYKYDSRGNMTDHFLYNSRGVLIRHNVNAYEYYGEQPEIVAQATDSRKIECSCDTLKYESGIYYYSNKVKFSGTCYDAKGYIERVVENGIQIKSTTFFSPGGKKQTVVKYKKTGEFKKSRMYNEEGKIVSKSKPYRKDKTKRKVVNWDENGKRTVTIYKPTRMKE